MTMVLRLVWLLPLVLAGCGPGTDAVKQAQDAPLRRAELLRAKPVAPIATARRCGWLHNPTPANWWLEDREGRWLLGTQSAEQAPGMDEMPDMSTAGWVETNGHYGYGCACMTLTVETATGKVLRLASPDPKPLKQCRDDKALPDPMADAVG